ncbi:hypothetical protein LOK49_LG09G00092 [Camellia lanceoleosa]|uniref:Uncharacterized protein n=1 Tax=Camellia lanceoleosa TaxID=1840588 RepID=A0ACC0GMK1_9ERIC|nr:hypothetical protein LOK49_LG09G00092 [Camellia lanceoleosa]
MEELKKGSIANPDEGRMVGHYWLRNPKLASKSIFRLQIENTLEAVCKFADDIVSGKRLDCFPQSIEALRSSFNFLSSVRSSRHPNELVKDQDGLLKEEKKELLKNPRELCRRYVDWFYQHKDLVPKFQAAFKAIEELEKGSIANPDEGQMVGHYWLRNPKLASKSILRL